MKLPYSALLAMLTALSSASLWSCNKENVRSEPTAGIQARERVSSPDIPPADDANAQQLRAGCPMVVQGADVTVADTKDGVVLTFTTDQGDVDELRQRVQYMAQMYEMHGGRGHMMWHHMEGWHHMGPYHHGGPGMGMGYMGGYGPMPAASAAVTTIDKGARLELKPTYPSQLEALREHARWQQERMHEGACWTLQTPSQNEQE